MQRIMENRFRVQDLNSICFREDKLIGYNFSLVTLKDIKHSHGLLLVMQMNRKWLFVKNDGNAGCFFKNLECRI